jgi:hypothetical protein
MQTLVTKALAVLIAAGILALASVGPSAAEPTFRGYPQHNWYTPDGY